MICKISSDYSCSKEIGGYFGLEELVSNEYYKELIALNTARNALLYLLRAKNIVKIYLPYYLCKSVRNMLIENNYAFEYYNIDSAFNPIFNNNLHENEYMYIVNYYGQITNEKVIHLKKKYKNIILDNAMAFFQPPLNNVDTIYSCRKFFGVPDGAYLSTDVILKDKLEFATSKDRMKHLLGRYEATASKYYHDFKRNELSYEGEPLRKMSKLTANIMGAIDFERVKQLRNKNYAYLKNKLDEINKLKLTVPNGPFNYPFYVENGIELRIKLAENKIYIPTLWSDVLEIVPKNSVEYMYVADILPLPCDQRYCEEDLDLMCDILFSLL